MTYDKILVPLLTTERTDTSTAGTPVERLRCNLKEVLASTNAGAEEVLGKGLFISSRIGGGGRLLTLRVSDKWQGLELYVRECTLAAVWEMYERLCKWYLAEGVWGAGAGVVVSLQGVRKQFLGRRTAYSSYVPGGERYEYRDRGEAGAPASYNKAIQAVDNLAKGGQGQ